jgi:hypothetical protein
MTTTSPQTPAEWQQHLEQADAERLSLAAYAKINGLKINMLYYWRAKLRVVSTGTSASSEPVKFAAVRISAAPTASAFIINLPAQVSLQLSTLPDPHWLADLCRQLERRP